MYSGSSSGTSSGTKGREGAAVACSKSSSKNKKRTRKEWKEPKEEGSLGERRRERGGEENHQKVYEVGIAIKTNERKEEKDNNCKRIERSRERSRMTGRTRGRETSSVSKREEE